MSSIKEKKVVESTVEVGKKCDVCGLQTLNRDVYDKWIHGNHHHGDWGYDSQDSYEWFDICSPKCFRVQLERSITELGKTWTGEIFGMPLNFAKALLAEFNTVPAVDNLSLAEAIKVACEKPTLVDALAFMAELEAERAIRQALCWKETGVSTASHGGGWDTCFRHCFNLVMESWKHRCLTSSIGIK